MSLPSIEEKDISTYQGNTLWDCKEYYLLFTQSTCLFLRYLIDHLINIDEYFSDALMAVCPSILRRFHVTNRLMHDQTFRYLMKLSPRPHAPFFVAPSPFSASCFCSSAAHLRSPALLVDHRRPKRKIHQFGTCLWDPSCPFQPSRARPALVLPCRVPFAWLVLPSRIELPPKAL